MLTPTRLRLISSLTPNLMATRLSGLNIAALKQAQDHVAKTPPAPAARKAAAAKAKAAADSARAKALGKRSAAANTKVAAMNALAVAAKARLAKRWRSAAMRSPAQVVKAVLDRIGPSARPVARAEQTSILIRGAYPTVADFTAALAPALGLANAAALRKRGIGIRQVAPPRRGRGAIYAVRLPIKRSSMRTEAHNLAWALRKSGKFVSVRPDGGRKMVFASAPGHAERAERVFAWSHILTRTNLAHDLAPAATGAALGQGIIIAHPDTGWTTHPNLNGDQIDQADSFNAGTETRGAAAAETSSAFADSKLSSVNHGTATASIMIGAKNPRNGLSTLPEDEIVLAKTLLGGRNYSPDDKVADRDGTLTGVAPKAMLRSIKFIADVQADIDATGLNGIGVVRFADEDLVTAIDFARTSGAHVVSLSVGGLMHDGVRDAIDEAVEANVIIVAAAGQTYTGEGLNVITSAAAGIGIGTGDTVVTPAAYANVIAVAGCTQDGRPWDESLRGPNVDITAPADAMWVADFEYDEAKKKRTPVLEAAAGTSFATAFMAGVAALWLGHWGRAHLLAEYPDTPLAWVFRHQLQKTAGAVRANDWDTGLYGPGVVDVLALLKEPLPDPDDVPPPPATTENVFTFLSGTMDSPAAEFAADVWGVIYDGASYVAGQADAFADASWAAVRATADNLMGMGEAALADLNAYADAQGATVDRATRDAIGALTDFLESAADAGEEAMQAAAEDAEDAVDAAVDFVEESADAVGEAAEDVADFLFGWAT
jgi:hypothetical protein